MLAVALILIALPIYGIALGSLNTSDFGADMRVVAVINAKIQSIGANITVSNIKTLHDFAGNVYKLAECSPEGYFIIHPESGVMVEYSRTGESPYADKIGELFYLGPTYYYSKINNKYVHTEIDEEIGIQDANELIIECQEANDALLLKPQTDIVSYLSGETNTLNGSVYDTQSAITFWVNGHTYFRNLNNNFGYMNGNCCGYIAANLILKYYDNRGKIDLPSSYMTSHTALTDALLDYNPLSSNESDGYVIADVIDEFCRDNGLPQRGSAALGISGVTSEIENNKRPCIIFGGFYSSFDPVGAHAVTAYGYNNFENEGWDTFIVHFGHNNRPEVHICGDDILYGSNTKYLLSNN